MGNIQTSIGARNKGVFLSFILISPFLSTENMRAVLEPEIAFYPS